MEWNSLLTGFPFSRSVIIIFHSDVGQKEAVSIFRTHTPTYVGSREFYVVVHPEAVLNLILMKCQRMERPQSNLVSFLFSVMGMRSLFLLKFILNNENASWPNVVKLVLEA